MVGPLPAIGSYLRHRIAEANGDGTLRSHSLSFVKVFRYDENMSPWYFDPHSGGTPVPPKVQEETRKRILARADIRQFANLSRLDIRFKGQFCYIDAYEKGSTTPIHLCRLRYFSGHDKWSLAFYTYSHEKYEPCVFHSGEWLGTPEEAFDIGSVYLS
jgi:hypothetical protein